MIRINKLADYAFTLLTHFAQAPRDQVLTATELAASSQLPLPTVTKILKLLAHGEVLISQRGVNGGYRLSASPEAISVVQIIAAMDGPISITECVTGPPGACDFEPMCPTSEVWHQINETVRGALEHITLQDITRSVSVRARAVAARSNAGPVGLEV